MKFQVMNSAIKYSHPVLPSRRGVTLEFSLYPIEIGELKFSDGSRLMGCDLSEKYGDVLTIGDIVAAHKKVGYQGIDDEKFWPLEVKACITFEPREAVSFLKTEEFACGFVDYRNDEYFYGLYFWLSVSEEVFRDLLTARLDSGGETTFDIKVRGLADTGWGNPFSLSGTWNLDDKSDCGSGNRRVVADFSLGPRLIQSQNARAVARATPERKLAASLS